jgi:hypothetical protein
MYRTLVALGRPYKYRDGIQVIHAAQRPAAPANIDFDGLDLKFKLTHKPDIKILKHYWAPKPETVPDLPFFVERAQNGLTLPVYTDYKGGRTKVVTILRKIKGDIGVLHNEVEKVCGVPVIVRPGKLVVEGNFHRRLKVWLTGLGF